MIAGSQDAPTSPYAIPINSTGVSDCYFYHTMEIPGHGVVEGEWDLRGNVDAYLGGASLSGKRVLELGTASGFLCFSMEQRGAEVVAYDLSDEYDWDIVPFAADDVGHARQARRAHIGSINKAWWLAHRAFRSNARVVYGSVYEVPDAIGPVHVSTFGSILLHLRDPFRALEQGLRNTTETAIVTERMPDWARSSNGRPDPRMRFLPDPATGHPKGAWWAFSPDIIRRFIGVLGFEDSEVTYHEQTYRGQSAALFTVVGHRNR
jgi:hypothetical protein